MYSNTCSGVLKPHLVDKRQLISVHRKDVTQIYFIPFKHEKGMPSTSKDLFRLLPSVIPCILNNSFSCYEVTRTKVDGKFMVYPPTFSKHESNAG